MVDFYKEPTKIEGSVELAFKDQQCMDDPECVNPMDPDIIQSGFAEKMIFLHEHLQIIQNPDGSTTTSLSHDINYEEILTEIANDLSDITILSETDIARSNLPLFLLVILNDYQSFSISEIDLAIHITKEISLRTCTNAALPLIEPLKAIVHDPQAPDSILIRSIISLYNFSLDIEEIRVSIFSSMANQFLQLLTVAGSEKLITIILSYFAGIFYYAFVKKEECYKIDETVFQTLIETSLSMINGHNDIVGLDFIYNLCSLKIPFISSFLIENNFDELLISLFNRHFEMHSENDSKEELVYPEDDHYGELLYHIVYLLYPHLECMKRLGLFESDAFVNAMAYDIEHQKDYFTYIMLVLQLILPSHIEIIRESHISDMLFGIFEIAPFQYKTLILENIILYLNNLPYSEVTEYLTKEILDEMSTFFEESTENYAVQIAELLLGVIEANDSGFIDFLLDTKIPEELDEFLSNVGVVPICDELMAVFADRQQE